MVETVETRVAVVEHTTNIMADRLERMEGKLDKFIEKADDKYASKRMEVALYWALGLVIAAIITAIMNLIIK